MNGIELSLIDQMLVDGSLVRTDTDWMIVARGDRDVDTTVLELAAADGADVDIKEDYIGVRWSDSTREYLG